VDNSIQSPLGRWREGLDAQRPLSHLVVRVNRCCHGE
jgi:hypothetical protein